MLFLSLILVVAAFGQKKPVPVSSPTTEPDDIIRISSKLVLVDALVLDKDNRQVTDLTPEDFKVYQDGILQKITNFAYIGGGKKDKDSPDARQKKKRSGKKALPVPPFGVQKEQGRFITFVIDDGNCLASLSGLATARDGVRKFIDREMLPDDRVAIYRTRGGSNLLQIYTSNKGALKRIVNKVNWAPSSCGSAFDPAEDKSTMKPTGSFESEEDKLAREAREEVERNDQVIGTVGVLSFVIDRLKNLPRRKLLFFISEGIPVKFGSRGFLALRDVSDKAIRSAVVIYTMSEKGLTIPGFISAEDEVLARIIDGKDNITRLRESREDEERSLNEGLAYLAYSTGGKFIRNKNYLETQMKKVLDSETGYYLLGYQPESETFKGKKYHHIEVRLNRTDLTVSSRRGFYGTEERELRSGSRNKISSLYRAIASPFRTNNMDLRLTTLVGSDRRRGYYIRALLHINGEDLTFTDEPDGMKKVELNVVMVTLDEKGRVVGEFNRSYPIRIPAAGVEIVRKNGLDYATDLPVKKPGFYSFRLAVQDNRSKRLGSAGDLVQIPENKKDRIFITGLVTTAITRDRKPLWPAQRSPEKAFAPVFFNSIPSVRQYYAGAPFAYVYEIFNAKLEKASGRPKLTARTRLYKDGKMVVEGKETPLQIEPQADLSRIRDYGFLRLNSNAAPGEYILQLIVRDTLANRTATRWIDFEVIDQ